MPNAALIKEKIEQLFMTVLTQADKEVIVENTSSARKCKTIFTILEFEILQLTALK